MTRLAIAMDLGTSGFRAQALDLSRGEVLSTAISTRNPLPGENVIDHLHFALELGVEAARDLVIQAVNRVLGQLRVSLGDVVRLAVCGNPTQLSLFQGMEIRDLAFAGSRKLSALGIEPPLRPAAIRRAAEFPGLDLPGGCDVLLPPAVRDEVGADTLALILQTGMQHCEQTAIAIDYGTNAEMVLIHEGRLFTGSAAAGPALEGQHISCGTLAMPGAIADLTPDAAGHRLFVLDAEMQPVLGARIDLSGGSGALDATGPETTALTGTGVIAAMDQALAAGLVALPHIRTPDRRLHFGEDIFLTETDLAEAGKAIGAIRAGYFTLCVEAGITPADIRTAYLAGASGTYVDARKSGRLGLVPPRVSTVRQVGNTSLAMARELALSPGKLEAMARLAGELRQTHCMFASSRTFSKVFLLELSLWTEGMPAAMYREMLRRYRLPDLPPTGAEPQIVRTVKSDIGDPGRMGLVTLTRAGRVAAEQLDGCSACMSCVEACPAHAITVRTDTEPPAVAVEHDQCYGVACRRCEPACSSSVFRLNAFFGAARQAEAPRAKSVTGVIGVLTCEVLELEFARLLGEDPDVGRISVLADRHSARLIALLLARPVRDLQALPHVRGFQVEPGEPLPVLVRVLPLALHRDQKVLRDALAGAAHEIAPRVDALVLGYGLCGNALGDARAVLDVDVPIFQPMDGDHPVDDCVALCLGGRECYYEEQRKTAGTFFLTPGWSEHWKQMLDPRSGELMQPGLKRALADYERALLVQTPALSDEELSRRGEELRRLTGLFLEARPGTMEPLSAAFRAAKDLVASRSGTGSAKALR